MIPPRDVVDPAVLGRPESGGDEFRGEFEEDMLFFKKEKKKKKKKRMNTIQRFLFCRKKIS
jgi:hypothetical protein